MVKGIKEHTCTFKLTSSLIELLGTQDLCLRFSQYIIASTLNLKHVKIASKKKSYSHKLKFVILEGTWEASLGLVNEKSSF